MIGRLICGILLTLLPFLSVDAQEWQRLGPPGGMVISLGSGAGGTIYLGTSDGHIFVKESSRTGWELRGRVSRRTDAVVSQLLVDPLRTRVAFAAVWYRQPGAGGGVFRTEDGGRTWTSLGLQDQAVRALEFVAARPDSIVAGTRTGVFRSADAGNTWRRITPEGDPELRNVDSLATDPRDTNIIYVGTYHLPWKTTDGGQSWSPVTAGLIDDSDIMSLRVDATNPERLFLSACSGIYRSENQGGQWTKLQGIPYAARRTQAIVQDLDDPQTLYAGTTEGLWVTWDAGENWERTTPGDWVINSVTVVPGAEGAKDRVVIGTETRGVQSSEDAGRTFREYNEGFSHQVVQQLVGDPSDSMHLAMLLSRDGAILWESRDGGNSWNPLPAARPESKKGLRFAPEAVEKIFPSPWGWLARLNTGRMWILDMHTMKWSEWKLHLPISPGKVAARSNQTTIPGKSSKGLEVSLPNDGALDFSNEAALVATKEGLLRCDKSGTCARLKSLARGGQASAVQVSADGSQLTVALDGKLATSSDGGQIVTWNDLPVANSDVLWIGAPDGKANYFLGTVQGLFASPDGGATWRRCGQGLPAGSVERILHAHGFLAATLREGGLYISRDGGSTWIREDNDAERGRFTGAVETAPGTLTIGSQSEGILRWPGGAPLQ